MKRLAVVSAMAGMLMSQPAVAQAGRWGMADFSSVSGAARAGDKTAQLELGRRYETGSGGASCDLKTAAHWYRRAARSSGGDRLAYSAPVGSEKYGRMVGVGGGSVVPGLPEAARRLDALRARSGPSPVFCGKAGGGQ